MFKKPLSELPPVFGFGKDSTGEIYSGTVKGQLIQPNRDGYLIIADLAAAGIDRAEITDCFFDQNGGIWLTSAYQGLGYFKNGSSTQYDLDDGTGDNSFFSFFQSQEGRLFALGDGGITELFYDREQPGFKRFSFEPGGGRYVVFNSAVQIENGKILLASDQGLFWFQNEKLVPIQLSGFAELEPFITQIKQRASGNILIATKGMGLIELVVKGDSLQTNQRWMGTQSLPENVWLDLELDNTGNVWIGSYRQLCRIGKSDIDPIICLNEKDGFFPANYPDLHLEISGETLFAGCTNGLRLLDLNQLKSQPQEFAPYIRNMRYLYNDKNFYSWEDTLSETPIRLATSENDLVFQFAGFSYRNQENNLFKYRLFPLDKDWQLAQNQYEVIYRQLPPGEYQFELSAGQQFGGWSAEPARLSFKINPPFWQQTWFFLLSALLLILMVYGLYRWRQKRRQQKEIQQNLDYFATSTYGENTEEEILWDAARNVIASFGWEDCVIYLLEEGQLVQKAAMGPKTAGTEAN